RGIRRQAEYKETRVSMQLRIKAFQWTALRDAVQHGFKSGGLLLIGGRLISRSEESFRRFSLFRLPGFGPKDNSGVAHLQPLVIMRAAAQEIVKRRGITKDGLCRYRGINLFT